MARWPGKPHVFGMISLGTTASGGRGRDDQGHAPGSHGLDLDHREIAEPTIFGTTVLFRRP